MERIVEIEKITLEKEEDIRLRPTCWDDYIGQEKLKKNLQVFIAAAKKRGDVLDHLLLFGPPGLGKTTLAHIISAEMQTSIKVTAAPMIEKAGDLAAILTNLNDGEILFIDEIHRLSPAIEEILYPAMEDFRLDIIIGSGPAAQTVKIDLPRFTLIGATTRAGMISNRTWRCTYKRRRWCRWSWPGPGKRYPECSPCRPNRTGTAPTRYTAYTPWAGRCRTRRSGSAWPVSAPRSWPGSRPFSAPPG